MRYAAKLSYYKMREHICLYEIYGTQSSSVLVFSYELRLLYN